MAGGTIVFIRHSQHVMIEFHPGFPAVGLMATATGIA
jgi:hypothetical protein